MFDFYNVVHGLYLPLKQLVGKYNLLKCLIKYKLVNIAYLESYVFH